MGNIKNFNEFHENDRAQKLESDNPLNDAVDGAPRKGFLMYVYRNDLGDGTAGGMTSKVTKVTLIGKGLPAMFTPSEDAPALYLRDDKKDYIYASPVETGSQDEHGPYMFGGNFIYSSDSRLAAISKYPIPVHDRHESWSNYHSMSRD